MTRPLFYTTSAIIAASAVAMTFAQAQVRQDGSGYTTAQITAAHRAAPIDVHIWYPSDTAETPTVIAENILFNGFAAYPDAQPTGPAAPVIVFSHGSGGRAVQSGWLAAQLAAQGMIDVAPNHQGTMTQDSDPHQTPMIWQRTQDMSVVLDALEAGDLGGFTPDMDRVAAMGFSLGGGAALTLAGAQLSKADFISYCAALKGTPDCDWMQAGGVDFTQIDQALYEADWRDPRISGVLAIDPALTQAMTDASLAQLEMPVLTLGLGNAHSVPLAVDAYHLQDALAGAQHAWVPEAAHFSFLPSCGVIGKIATAVAGDDNICSDWGLRNRDEVHGEIADHATAFFTQLFAAPS